MDRIASLFLGVYLWSLESYRDKSIVLILLRDNVLKLDASGYLQSSSGLGMIDGLLPNEIEIGKEFGKINCIKAVKTRTGLSLLDCKNMVELCFSKNHFDFGRHKPME